MRARHDAQRDPLFMSFCDFPSDPVLSRVPFQHRALLYPMGFPLEVETNSLQVIQALRRSWEMFPPQFEENPLRMSVGVMDSDKQEPVRTPAVRSRLNLFSIVSDAGNFLTADFTSGCIFGWLTTGLVDDESFCRFHFLDMSVLTVLQQRYLAPIHGALVDRNGKGIAFCGNSAAGKSTIAYACARAGWTYVADDATYLLQNSPRPYAVGNSHVIHFRAGARELFPELRGHVPYTRPNGKFGMETYTRDLPITTAPGTTIEHIVFLNRIEGASPKMTRCESVKSIEWCSRFVEWGDDTTRIRQLEAYSQLRACDVWDFEYSDITNAVGRLDDLIHKNQ
jgi:hypothetical protein